MICNNENKTEYFTILMAFTPIYAGELLWGDFWSDFDEKKVSLEVVRRKSY